MTRPPNVVKRTLQGTAAQPVPIAGPVPMAAPQPHPPVVPAASAPPKLDPFVLNPVRSRHLHGVRTSMLNRGRIQREIDWIVEYLQWLDDIPSLQPIGMIANFKGTGSKSTTGNYTGSIHVEYTNRPTLLLPSTINTKTADAAAAAGILEDMPGKTVKELAELVATDPTALGNYRALDQHIAMTQTGLYVVREESRVPKGNHSVLTPALTTERFSALTDALVPNVKMLIHDTGQDDIEKGSLPDDVSCRATVFAFTSTVGTSKSVSKMQETISEYLRLARTQQPDEVARREATGHHVSNLRKLQNAIVVTSKVNPGVTMDITDLTGSAFEAAGFGPDLPWHGVGIQVPYDPYLVPDNSVCDIHAIQPLTRRAYLLTTVAYYVMTARNLGVPLTEFAVTKGQRKNPLFVSSALAPQAAASTTGPAHRELVPAV